MLGASIGAETHGLGSEASIIGNVFGTARTIHSTASGDGSLSFISLDAVDAFSVSSEIGSTASGANARSTISINSLNFFKDADIQVESSGLSSEAAIYISNASGNINEINLLSDANSAESRLTLEGPSLFINNISATASHSGDVYADVSVSTVGLNAIDVSISSHGLANISLQGNIALGSGDFETLHNGLFINSTYGDNGSSVNLGSVDFNYADLSVHVEGSSISTDHQLSFDSISGTIDNLTLYGGNGLISLDLSAQAIGIDDIISIEAHHSGDVYLTANIHSSDFNNIHVSASTYGYVSVDLSGNNITAQNIYISTSSEANVHVSIDQITLNGNIELYSSSLSSEVSGDWSTSSLDIQSLSGNLDHITLSAEDGGGTLLNVNGIISVNTIHLYASGDDYNGGISIVSLDGSSLDATLQDFTLEAYGGGNVYALLGNLSISGNLTLHADGFSTDVYRSTGDLNLSRIDLMAGINDSVLSCEDLSWHHGIHNISVIASDDGYVSLNLFGDSMGMDGNLEIASYHHGVAEVAFHGPVYMDGGNLSVAAEGFSISLDDTNESLEEYYGSTDLWAHTNFNLSLDSRSYINNINVSQSYLGEANVHLDGNYSVGNIHVTTYNDDGWGGGYASLDLGSSAVQVSGNIFVKSTANAGAYLSGENVSFSQEFYPGETLLRNGSITVEAYSGESHVNLAGTFEADNLSVVSVWGGAASLDLIGTTHVYGDISVQASYDNASAYLFANLSGSDLNNIIVSAEYSADINVELSGDFHADHLMVNASGSLDWSSYPPTPYVYVSTINFLGDDTSTFNLHNLTVSSEVSHVNVILDGNLEIDGNINVSARGAYYYDNSYDIVPVSSSSMLMGSYSGDMINAEGSSLHDISVTSQTYGDSRVYLGGNITLDGSIEIRAGGWSAYSDDSFSILSLETATLNHANLAMFELGSNTNTVFNYQSLQGTIDDLNLRAEYGGSVSLEMNSLENHIRISGDILATARSNATLHLSADINGSTLHNISVEAIDHSSESNVNLLGSITVDGQISIVADYGSIANLNLQSVDFENTNLYMQNANFNYSASTGNINNFTDIVYGSRSLSDEASHWYGWFETQINGDINLATHYESALDLTLLDVNSFGTEINLISGQNSFISADIQSLTGTVDDLRVQANSWEGYDFSGAEHVYSNEVQLFIHSMGATIDNIMIDSASDSFFGLDFSSDFSVDIQGKVNINQSGNIFINPGSDDFLSLNLDEVNANISHISIGNEAESVDRSFASLQMNAVYGNIGSVLIGSDDYTRSIALMTIGNDSNRSGLISDVTFNQVSLYQDACLFLYASDHNAIYANVSTFNVFEGELNLQSFGSNSMISLDVGSLSPYRYSSGSILLSTDISSDNQTINLSFESANFTSLDLTINALGHNSDITFSAPTATGNIHDLVLETSSTGSELYVDIGGILVHGNVDVTGASGGKTTLTNSGGPYDLQSLSLTGDGGNAYVDFTNAHINIHDTLTLSNQSSDSNVWLYVDSGISFDDASLIIEDVGASNVLYFNGGSLSGTIHDLSLNFSADTSFTLDLGGSISIDHDISVRAHSGDYVHLIGNIDGSNIHDFTAIAEGGSNVTISLAGSVDVSGNVLLSTDGSDNSLNVYINHTHFDNANLTINEFGTNSTVDVIHPLNISGDFNNISIREKNGSHTSLISSENWLPFNGSYLLDADSPSSYITVDVGNLTLGRTIDSIILSADHSAEVSLTVDDALSLSGDISVNASNSGSVFATLNISSTDALHAIDIETLNSGYANISLQGNITLSSGDAEATHDGLFITANTWNNSSEITLGNIHFNHADLSLHAHSAEIDSGINFNFDSVSGTIDNLTLYGNLALVSLDLTGNMVSIHDTISIEADHSSDVYLTANIDGNSFNAIYINALNDGYVDVNLSGDITLGSNNLEVTNDGLFISSNNSSHDSNITLGNIEFNHADLSIRYTGNSIELNGIDHISGTIDNLTLYASNADVYLETNSTDTVTIEGTISIEAYKFGAVYSGGNIHDSTLNNIHVSADSSGYVSVDLSGDITADNIYISTSSEANVHVSIDQITLNGNIELYSSSLSSEVSGDWSTSSLDIQSLSGDLDHIILNAYYGGYSSLSINGNITVNDIKLSADSHSIYLSSEVDLSGNMDGSSIGNLTLEAWRGGIVSAHLSGEIAVTDSIALTASGHELTTSGDYQSNAYLEANVTGYIGAISVISANGAFAGANLSLSDIHVTDHILLSADDSDTILSLNHVTFDNADLTLRNNDGGLAFIFSSISGTIDNLTLDARTGSTVQFNNDDVNISGNVSLYSYGTSSLSMLSSDHATSLDLQSIHLEAYNQGTSFANFLTNDISVANEVNLYASGNNAEVRLDAGLITFNSADLTIEAFNTGEVIFGHGFHASGTIDNLTVYGYNALVNLDISGDVHIHDTISIEAHEGNLHLTANIDGSSFNTLHVSTDMGSTLDLNLQGDITLGSGNLEATHDGVFITSIGTMQADEITLGSIEFNHADLSLHAVDEGWISADIQSISGTINNLSLQASDARIYLHIGEDAVDSIGNITVSADGGSAFLGSDSMDHDITLQNIKVISSSGWNAVARLAGGDITVTEGILISTDSTTNTSAYLLVSNVIFDSADLSIHAFDGGNHLYFTHGTLSGTIDNLSLATANGSVMNLDLSSDIDISGNITVTSAYLNSSSSLAADLGVASVDFIDLEAVQSSESRISLLGSVSVHGGVLLSTDASSEAYLGIDHLHFDHASLTINEAGYDSRDTYTASFNIGSASGTIDGLFLRADDGAQQEYNLLRGPGGVDLFGNVDIVGNIELTSNGVGSSLELYGFSNRTDSHFDNISAVASDDGWLHLDARDGIGLTIDGNLEIASYHQGNAIVDFGDPITMAGGDLTVIAYGWNSHDIDTLASGDLYAHNNLSVSLDSSSEINNLNVSQRYGGEALLQLAGDFSVKNINVSTDSYTASFDIGGGFASLDLGTGIVDVSGNINVSAQFNQHANLSGNVDGSHVEDIYIGNYGGSVDVNLSGSFDVSGDIFLWALDGQASIDLSVNGSSLHNISVIGDDSGDATLNLSGAIEVTDNINVVADSFLFYPAFGEAHSSLTGSIGGSVFHNMSVISAFNGAAEVNLSGDVTLLNGTLSVKALDTAIPQYGLFFSGDTNASDLIRQSEWLCDPTFSPSTYVAFDHINFDGANLVIDKAGSSADLHLIINDASGTLNDIEVNAESGAHLSYYLPDNVSMSGDLTVKAVADNQYVCNDIHFTSVSFDASLANSFIQSIDIEASNLFVHDWGGGEFINYEGAFVSSHILGSINVQNINVSASAEDRASLILDHVSGPIDQVDISAGEGFYPDPAWYSAMNGDAHVNFAAHFDSSGYIRNLNINSFGSNNFRSNTVSIDLSQTNFGGDVNISNPVGENWFSPSADFNNSWNNQINLTYHGATASLISIDQSYEGGFNLTIDIGDQDYVSANDILKTSLTIDGLLHVSSDLSLNHLSGEMYINTSYEIDFNSLFIDAKDKIDNLGMNFYFAQLSGNSNDGYLFYDSDHKGITQMIELINVNESMMTAHPYDFARQFGATDFTVV